MSYQKDRDEFVGVIVAECITKGDPLETGVHVARCILRDASTVQRLAVKECNEPMSKGDNKRRNQAEVRITAACNTWGIVPNFSGDPRGCCVKLLLPSGRWNSWGGKEDGYCVPTR